MDEDFERQLAEHMRDEPQSIMAVLEMSHQEKKRLRSLRQIVIDAERKERHDKEVAFRTGKEKSERIASARQTVLDAYHANPKAIHYYFKPNKDLDYCAHCEAKDAVIQGIKEIEEDGRVYQIGRVFLTYGCNGMTHVYETKDFVFPGLLDEKALREQLSLSPL